MNLQEIEQQVKKNYDQSPYPGTDGSEINPEIGWSWVNLNWIGSLLPFPTGTVLPFKNILIAGCGTVNEAFQMCNSFPDAEIIAVDYSEKAIEIAKVYQKQHSNYANIRFEIGNLTVEAGDWVKIDHYDFISCHGVMSNIPNVQNVFEVLTKCLSAEGVLYTGVNGATHNSINIRKSFEYFGYDTDEFEDTLETRRLIELFDRLQPYQNHISVQTPSYLSSDILNTFSLNLTLSEWVGYAEKAKLNFISSADLIYNLEKTLSPNIFPLLIPNSRKALCEIVAINNVAPFHRLVFSKQIPPSIPWTDLETLLEYEFQTTSLYSMQNPASDIYGELILNAQIAPGYDIGFRWPLDDITIKLLSKQKGNRRIKDALGDEIIKAFKNNENALVVTLFMFHQFGVIKILPPSAIHDSTHP